MSTQVLRNAEDELACRVNDVPAVLAFLGFARYLDGCDSNNDERFEHGRQLIMEWLEFSCDFNPKFPELPEVLIGQLLYECAEVLYFLHTIEPLCRTCSDEDRRGRIECGYMEVLRWVERRILRASGIGETRPHKSAGENQRERIEAEYARHELEGGTTVN